MEMLIKYYLIFSPYAWFVQDFEKIHLFIHNLLQKFIQHLSAIINFYYKPVKLGSIGKKDLDRYAKH